MPEEVENRESDPTPRRGPGEPPGSPESPSTGPLRGRAASPSAEERPEVVELEALRAENEELIDTLQRVKAEFDN